MFPKFRFYNITSPQYMQLNHYCSKPVLGLPCIIGKNRQKGHYIKLGKYFESNPSAKKLKPFIPAKYFELKRKTPPESLYLIDSSIAKKVALQVFPILNAQKKNQIICETNAGLGLIASELLDAGIPTIRLYESCSDFRFTLKDFNEVYTHRVELFTKDIYQLSRIDHIDKQDRGNRVQEMLRGLSQRNWEDGFLNMHEIDNMDHEYLLKCFHDPCLLLDGDSDKTEMFEKIKWFQT